MTDTPASASSATAFEQARQLLDELIAAANAGAIIPVRLPGQLATIREALDAAEQEAKAASAATVTDAGFDKDAWMKEQAYFIGHAIHELRTPMTSIRGYSDMLGSMGVLNDMQKQFVETIRVNSRRMETLMQDVADMNKLRTNSLKIGSKMDMFKNIAMAVEKTMTPLAAQLERTLSFDIPSGLPLLNTDGELLARAINKLVENALRYQDADDDHTVTVTGAAEGNTLVITVADHGFGITADDFQKLGTVYFRSEDERVREYKGSGLGIPVAFGIVKTLGGDIRLHSEPDRGTMATIRITGME